MAKSGLRFSGGRRPYWLTGVTGARRPPVSIRLRFLRAEAIDGWPGLCHGRVAGLLNAWTHGFHEPAQFAQDANCHELEVCTIDIRASDWAEAQLAATVNSC
jgi:hypothetical protein